MVTNIQLITRILGLESRIRRNIQFESQFLKNPLKSRYISFLKSDSIRESL